MPIECSIEFPNLTTEQMRDIDYRVMGHAFNVQNSLGRLCDEFIYRNALLARLRSSGIDAVSEVPINLSFLNFEKTLYIDLVAANCVPYELKAVACFTPKHQRQLLNYLMLVGANRGKLVNFRSSNVESKFVNTRLTLEERTSFSVDNSKWFGDQQFQMVVVKLLRDWGTCLDQQLYLEAVTANLAYGSEDPQLRELKLDGVSLGRQKVQMFDVDRGIRFTSFKDDLVPELSHVSKLAKAAGLKQIYWVNVSLECVTFTTVRGV